MFAAGKAVSGATPTDAQFNYVTMLLHGDGTNGAQNNTFVDSSTNNFTITRNGNTTQGTFSPYGSNWSNYFDGSGDYLTFPSNSTFAFGTGDFTVEFWANETNWNLQGGTNYAHWISINSYLTGVMIRPDLTGSSIQVFVGGTQYTFTISLSLGTWYHIAVSRSSSSMRLFVNGTQVGSTQTVTYNILTNTSNTIGSAVHSTTEVMQGYLSNLRIVSGSAVYTSNFTPSRTPLTAITNTSLLTCADNRFIDDSTNNFTITKNGDVSVQRFSPFSPTSAYTTSVIGGSGYFDGSGDYLNVASQTALGMGSGDFTYEAWIYVNEIVPTNALRGLFDSRVSSSTGCGIYTSADSGTTSKLVYATNSAIVASSTNTIKAYAWTHVAVTRSSGTVRGFLNGVLEFTVTDSRTFSSSAPTYIGTDVSPQYFNGFINDVRILKGTAQYTSAFTPPTSPLTAITNTSLLLSYTNAGILDNAMMNDLETVGNAQISTSVKKYGTGSMYFDGSGDYLTSVVSPNNALGSGNFTIEGYHYCTGYNGGAAIYSTINTYPSSSGLLFYIDTNGKYTIDVNGTILQPSNTATLNAWVHFAVVRNSNTITIYIDGTSIGTVSSSTNYSDQYAVIGRTGAGSASNYFLGYLDDIRITKGYARYTSNFTAPTAPFPDKG